MSSYESPVSKSTGLSSCRVVTRKEAFADTIRIVIEAWRRYTPPAPRAVPFSLRRYYYSRSVMLFPCKNNIK